MSVTGNRKAKAEPDIACAQCGNDLYLLVALGCWLLAAKDANDKTAYACSYECLAKIQPDPR